MEKKSTGWKAVGVISFILSLLPLGMGFYKMFSYQNSEYSFIKSVNAYVGGDAYNYIINANYATGWFVLFGVLLLASIGCAVAHYAAQMRDAQYYALDERKNESGSSLPWQT